METEYVRSLHSNYERFLLSEKPEEKKYQYCMISRGGIKGLLSCSLRYLNGNAYLYYDISSKQNIAQLFQKDYITREWMRDFIWGMKHLTLELGRFLLHEQNILWDPEQIFQDLEKNEFSFVYYPYYDGENHFLTLLSFFVEHIDYEDELLVEYVYRIYEQYEKNGDIYLQDKIYDDLDILWGKSKKGEPKEDILQVAGEDMEGETETETVVFGGEDLALPVPEATDEKTSGRKGLLALFENRKHKQNKKPEYEEYKELMRQQIDGIAVAEQTHYDEEFGKTVFLNAPKKQQVVYHRIYSSDGRILAQLDSPNLLIGKSKDKVDLYLEDISVSRMHAKVVKTKDAISLEDLNSTNGTYINGERLQPYECKELEPGDEIRCGNIQLMYR